MTARPNHRRHPSYQQALSSVLQISARVLGRRTAARLARRLTNEIRLDGSNDISTNGERIVQRAASSDPAPVVLDVGAHFGEWSTSLLEQSGTPPRLHCFEPSRSSWERASESLAGRASVHQFGLSDKPGSAELVVVHEGAGSNSVVPFTDGRGSGRTELIELSTVDRFCRQNKLEHVTLLKIDAEGHDLAVLRGSQEMLSKKGISLVQFEYNARWIDARCFLLDAFILLQGYGYDLGKVTPRGIETYDRWHPELESFREANYLAFLPSWRGRLPTLKWWGNESG